MADARRPRLQTGLKDLRPGNRRSRTRRPQEDWIPVRVPALIDAELWRMAQEQLASNRARAARNTQHEYLLRGLLICGRCGRRLVGTWTALSHGRYICSARYPRSAPWSCEGRSVSAVLVESQVWDHLKGLLAEPDLLRARYQESRGDPAIVGSDEREHVRIERQVQGIEQEVQRLIDAYQIGAIALTELQDRRRRAEEHSHVLTNRLRELHQQRQAREQELRLLQGLEGFCASIHEALANPTFAVKQKVLQLVVDRIIVEDTRLVIRHVIPIGPVGLQPRHLGLQTPFLTQETNLILTWKHPLKRVVTQKVVVKQRRGGMKANEEIPDRSSRFMYLLKPSRQIFVLVDQRRYFQTEERYSLSFSAKKQPSHKRHANHQCIESSMHECG